MVLQVSSVKYGEAPLIKFHSLDPAVRFRDVWHDLHPPILASATLSPVSDVAEVLGLIQGIKTQISPVFPSYNYQSYAFLGCHSSPADNGELEIFNKLEKEILRDKHRKNSEGNKASYRTFLRQS